MTVYATGVTGTIGKHLANEVIDLKVRLESPSSDLNVSKFLESDVLIHLAGKVGTGLVDEDPAASHQINVLGTSLLAEKFLANGIGRFIYVSSSHVYESSSKPLKETDQVKPYSNYAKQKLEAEKNLLELFERKPERLAIVRVFSVLDWDVAPFTLGGAIGKLADPGSDFILQNSSDVRDFLTPRKIAEVLLEISTCATLFGKVNLCTGIGTTVVEAAETMLLGAGYGIPIDRIKPGVSKNPIIVGDNSKLISHLPKLDLRWTPSTLT
jgi:nucleoside-diphosphate-sugar epimerase